VFRRNTTSKDVVRSAVLAALVSAASLTAHRIGNGWVPEVWNVLLFAIPLAYGMKGVIAAVICGLLPSAIVQWEFFDPLRVSGEMVAIAAVRQVFPTMPGYLTVVGVWGVFVLPLTHAFDDIFHHFGGWSEEMLFFRCLQDVVFSLVAGALLLNQTVSVLLTQRPRRNRLSEILVHVTALCALVTLFTVLAALNRLEIFTSTNLNPSNTTAAFGLFTTLVLIPSLVGYRLSLIASREFLGIEPSSLSSEQALRYSAESKESFFCAMTSEGDFTSALDSKSDDQEAQREGLLRGVCAVDGDGTVLFMNDHFRALTDIVIPGVEGYALLNIAPDSELVQHITDLLRTSDPEREVVDEMRIATKQGRVRFLEISLRPHLVEDRDHDTNGERKPSPRVVTLRDITERRTIDHTLLNERRLESLEAFARGASESFSELLESICQRAQQLSPNATESAQDLCESIVKDTALGQSISNQLRELSAGFSATGRSRVDLGTMILERAPLLQKIPHTATPVVLDVASGHTPVEVNTALIAHAVGQLILNASESYGTETGTITLQVAEEEIDEALSNIHPGTRPGRFVRLRVMDSGQGMPPEVLAHAADPHFSTKEASRHKGLGLSTVFAIMRDHEGFMTLESKIGKGSCVSLYFPLRGQDAKIEGNSESRENSSAAVAPVSTTSEDNQV
jgi:signal transduction histidine kinase